MRQARAAALLEELEAHTYLVMDDTFYANRQRHGWDREGLDQAAEDLAAAGLAEFEGAYQTVTLWLAGARKGGGR